MTIFLYAVCFFWVAIGACLILYTDETRQSIRHLMETVDRKWLAAAAVVFGILLVIAAPPPKNTWFITLLGLISILKGGFIFLNPENSFTTVQKWFLDKATDQTFRFFGILWLIIGTAVFSWI